MKESVKLIFLAIFSISTSCSCHTPSSQQNDKQYSVLDSIIGGMQKDDVSDSAVAKMLQNYYGRDISNFNISRQYLSDCHLYWSDPGYKEGPDVGINDSCIVVSFTTTTYNDDGTEKYKDNFSFSFPLHDNIVIYSNRYYGKCYHGGSTKIYKNENDARFSGIDNIFINTKVPLLIRLEGIINKRK